MYVNETLDLSKTYRYFNILYYQYKKLQVITNLRVTNGRGHHRCDTKPLGFNKIGLGTKKTEETLIPRNTFTLDGPPTIKRL